MKQHGPREIAQMVLIAAGSLQLVAGVIWTIWIIHAFRRDKRRAREGLCMTCGYNLQQSKDRCPECGSAILGKK